MEGSAQVTRDPGMCRPPGPVRVRPGRREPSVRWAELGARAARTRRLPHFPADSSGDGDAGFSCTPTADPGATAGPAPTHNFRCLRLRISHRLGHRHRRRWAPGPCSPRLQRQPQPSHHDPGRRVREPGRLGFTDILARTITERSRLRAARLSPGSFSGTAYSLHRYLNAYRWDQLSGARAPGNHWAR